jgi:hypothetical protein
MKHFLRTLLTVILAAGTSWLVVGQLIEQTPSVYRHGIPGLTPVVSTLTSADVILTDTYANLSAAGTEGRLFLPSDGPYLLRDSGSVWDHFVSGFGKATVPAVADFSWVNQDTATANNTSGPLNLFVTDGDSHNHLLVKSIPSVPYTVTILFRVNLDTGSATDVGVGWRQSSDGKMINVRYIGSDSGFIISKWTDETAYSADYTSNSLIRRVFYVGVGVLVQLIDDNSNRIVKVSGDGINWQTMHTVGRADFLTADQLLVYGRDNGSYGAGISVLSWTEE